MHIKVLDRRGISGWLEIGVTTVMVLGVLALFAMPWTIRFIFTGRMTMNRYAQLYLVMILLLEYSDLVCLCVLWHARKILHNINSAQPFVADNARRIRVIALLAALLAVGYGVGMFFIDSLLAGAMCVIFCVIALFLLVCAELFRHAVDFKEENDATI